MSEERYLQFTEEGERLVTGVGRFHKECDPLPVSLSVANQYDTPALRALGWVVSTEAPQVSEAPAAVDPPEVPEGEE